jgi:hypothetical protein
MLGKIISLFLIIIILALAIMFDWGGSRDIATNVVDFSQTTVETLGEAGDHLKEAMDTVGDAVEPAEEAAKEASKSAN